MAKHYWAEAKLYTGYRWGAFSGASCGINPLRVLWICPHIIKSITSPRFDDESLRGRIVPGDWDRSLFPVESLPTYRGFKQRFLEGYDWKDTVLSPQNYQPMQDSPREILRFEKRDNQWFAEWTKAIDMLALSLQKNGWRDAKEMGYSRLRNLSICVTRHGEIVRARSGLHRLIFAQLFNIGPIPVVVFSIHKDFDQSSLELMSKFTCK